MYLYIRAQGVGGGHNTRIETAVFFCSGSFFFLTQVRQVKVVFLRTLRNAATRLSSTSLLLSGSNLYINFFSLYEKCSTSVRIPLAVAITMQLSTVLVYGQQKMTVSRNMYSFNPQKDSVTVSFYNSEFQGSEGDSIIRCTPLVNSFQLQPVTSYRFPLTG